MGCQDDYGSLWWPPHKGTKAKRQALISVSVPLLPLFLHNTASGIALLLLSGHTHSKVEKPHTHLHNESMRTYSTCHTIHGACTLILYPCARIHLFRDSEKNPCTHGKSNILHSNLWKAFSDINILTSFQRNMRHRRWQEPHSKQSPHRICFYYFTSTFTSHS